MPFFMHSLMSFAAQPPLRFPLSIHILHDSRPCQSHEDKDELSEFTNTRSTSPSPNPLEDVPQSLSIDSPQQTQSRRNRRRALKRKQQKEEAHFLKSQSLENHVIGSDQIPVSINATAFKYPSANFLKQYRTQELSIQQIKDLGFHILEWDGITARVTCDSQKRIISILAGQPLKDESYLTATTDVYLALKEEGQKHPDILDPKAHRRGTYYGLTCGISHGNGTLSPINLQVPTSKRATLHKLLGDHNVQRMAGHANAALHYWAPELWQRYSKALKTIVEDNKSLEKPFLGSVFPCTTFNFGPHVWTYIHRDSQNVAYGFCAIHALGRFDPKKGGHLVLWDLQLAIEFPPGSLILIPSALLYHSNIPIQPGEERASFTHFYPAGLLRYAETGLKTDKNASEGLDEQEQKKFLKQLKADRLRQEFECIPVWNL